MDFLLQDYDHLKPSYIKNLSRFYIDSFNFVIDEGLKKACMDIQPVYTNSNPSVKISIDDAKMIPVEYAMNTRRNKNPIYPSEARMRGVTYYAAFPLKLKFEYEDIEEYIERTFFLPLMLKSDLCLLKDLTEEQLMKFKEDINDPGGYFIINGKERIVRQFNVPKRNYPLGLIDKKWKQKGRSEFGILVSCLKDSHSIADFYLHFCKNGFNHPYFDVRFFYGRKTLRMSVILLLKALFHESDYSLLQEIIKFRKNDSHYKKCIINMMTTVSQLGSNDKILSQEMAKNYIGKLCMPELTGSSYLTHGEVAETVIRSSVLIHLTKDEDKVQLICFCMSKLFSIVKKECKADDLDNPCFQEVLTPAQIYLIAVKKEIKNFLTCVKFSLAKKIKALKDGGVTSVILKNVTNYAPSPTPNILTIFKTGNFPGFECGLKSETGYTISLKRTNVFEVGAQFAAVNKFSMKFYSNSMRKFYPESWGFLCPAQTPEGEFTSLKNYLTKGCQIVQAQNKTISIHILYKIGLNSFSPTHFEDSYGTIVFVDGFVLGWVFDKCVEKFLDQLQTLRSDSSDYVPDHTEIIYIPKVYNPSYVFPRLFPGIYILSSPWRLVRKVKNLGTQKEELLGSLEQLTTQVHFENQFGITDTAAKWSDQEEESDEEAAKLSINHTIELKAMKSLRNCSEINASNFLGFTASSIPFGEFNPCKRNILASAKMKQAISLPFLNYSYRSDTKCTVMLYPQSPLVCTDVYAYHNFDENPMGTNMCICILSYSGYDMEDSVVLNKASIQRGLVRDHVYKTIIYDFKDLASSLNCNPNEVQIKCDPKDPHIIDYLDKDGMPYVGAMVVQGNPVLSVYTTKDKRFTIKRYEEATKAFIESVRLLGVNPTLINGKSLPTEEKKISITYRIQRIVEVGDKFNNRHSQKGICGYLMSPEDLPFGEDGSVPDIIFNPHGLSSRMSIGMLFEIVSAKSATVKGTRHVVVPFEFSDKMSPLEKFGPYLMEAGLDYHGTQKFYSGISGEELEADVFCGAIYYFKLTHVVQDKFQIGSIGEVDPVTQQPVNLGRSGAIRFGEMERDSILAHGAMELTLDRLLFASDRCEAYLCQDCDHLINPTLPNRNTSVQNLHKENKICLLCGNSDTKLVQIPYVLITLMVELAAAGLRISLPLK